jgi:hypothetical protein
MIVNECRRACLFRDREAGYRFTSMTTFSSQSTALGLPRSGSLMDWNRYLFSGAIARLSYFRPDSSGFSPPPINAVNVNDLAKSSSSR